MQDKSLPIDRRVFLSAGIVSALSVTAAAPKVSAQQNSRKTLGVIAFDKALSSDIVAPIEVFGYAIAGGALQDYEVATIGVGPGPVTTNEGLVIDPTYTLSNAPPLDILVAPSALNMAPILANDQLIDFVKTRAPQATWLCSNCSGVYIYAHAGLLRGRRVTTYPGGEIWLKAKHPLVRIEMNQAVVVDDKFITSNGALVSYLAALELLSRAASPEIAARVRRGIYLDELINA